MAERIDDEYFGRAESKPTEHEPTEVGALHGTAVHDDSAHLTLTEIEKRTGISYVTLIRYAQQYRDRLPCEGEGNKRRYYPAAIEEFQRIKAEIAARQQTGRRRQDLPAQISPRRGRKKPRSKVASKKRQSTLPAATPSRTEKPAAVSKIETSASSMTPFSDLDRMARLYQLKIQRKSLDGVLAFVTEWWTRIDAEIRELEK